MPVTAQCGTGLNRVKYCGTVKNSENFITIKPNMRPGQDKILASRGGSKANSSSSYSSNACIRLLPGLKIQLLHFIVYVD